MTGGSASAAVKPTERRIVPRPKGLQTPCPADGDEVSHNLLGQRLGRKGQITRQRILAAAQALLDDSETPFSLSAVAREVSLSMTAIYLYFADISELLLALLEPTTKSSNVSHLEDLETFWPDDELGERCQLFIRSYRAFWDRNAGLLLLRNQLADAGDARMKDQRVASSTPLIAHIVRQMGGPDDNQSFNNRAMAAVLVTGIDRVMTIHSAGIIPPAGLPESYPAEAMVAQGRLLELAIREARLFKHR